MLQHWPAFNDSAVADKPDAINRARATDMGRPRGEFMTTPGVKLANSSRTATRDAFINKSPERASRLMLNPW